MNTPMSRQEFLWHTGAAVLAIIGISGLIRNLEQSLGHRDGTRNSSNNSYGSTAYGGGRDGQSGR